MSLEELTSNGKVELDFYWKPKYMPEAQHKADSSYFEKPTKIYQPEKPKTDEAKIKKLKLAKAKATDQQQRIRILELENQQQSA